MARIGLSSAISGSLIERLSALSSGDTTIQNFQRPVIGEGVSVNISSGLRLGAQTFATAIQNLNLSATVVLAARETLGSLLELTEDVLTVAQKASQPGLGQQSIQRHSLEFRSLGNKFEKIIREAELEDTEILTVEGLTEFLTKAGLDPKAASSIADVFNRFILRPGEGLLASETVDHSRQVHIPPGAYSGRLPAYAMTEEVSPNAGVTAFNLATGQGGGYVTTAGFVYETADENFGTEQVFIKTNDGVEHNITDPSTSVYLLGANETTGYSLIQGNHDPLGHNASGYWQIFIADATGSIIHQVTSNANANVNYKSADFSEDSKDVAWVAVDNFMLSESVEATNIITLGSAPTLVQSIAAGDSYESVKVSNDGQYIAYMETNGGRTLNLQEFGIGTSDPTVAALTDVRYFGFSGSNELALARSATGDPTSYDFVIQTIIDGGSLVTKQSNVGVYHFATLEGGTGETGYYAYNDEGSGQFRLYSESLLVSSYTYEVGDSITNLSLAFNSVGRVEVGVAGQLLSISGDSAPPGLGYKFSNGTEDGNIRRSEAFDEIFDSSRQIRTRADAYRLVSDLKGLKEQLEENLEALDSGVETIQNNINFIRAAGFAFLDVSGRIKDSDDADAVATEIRRKIRASTNSAAISEAHNLEPLIVAALTIQAAAED